MVAPKDVRGIKMNKTTKKWLLWWFYNQPWHKVIIEDILKKNKNENNIRVGKATNI